MHLDLEVDAPIVIGSIPLRSTFSNFSVAEYQQQEPGNPFFQAYPDLRKAIEVVDSLLNLNDVISSAPPSYNVANFGFEDDGGGGAGGNSSDEEGENASQGYAPRYLTYGFSTPNQDIKH